MRITIDHGIFAAWPQVQLGIVTARQVNNQTDLTAWHAQQLAMTDQVRQIFPTSESVGQHPNIQAWRKAYRAFGADPSKYRCSHEALVRQVLRGNTIWDINPLVDCYNYISLKYTVPVGGEDCAKIVGDVVLRRADGTESFIRLGGTDNESPAVGEVIYADDAGVLCRRWNWRESDRTKLTSQTDSAVLVIETLPPMTEFNVQYAAAELATLVQQWCTAQTQVYVLNMQQPSIEFSF